MIDRRRFIQGTAGSAVAIQPVITSFARAPGNHPYSAHVVHDIRCSYSHDVFAAMGIHEVHVLRLNGDTTDIWSKHLQPAWKGRRLLTAGVTLDAEFFVLKTLAQDHGYKVIYEHSADDTVTWLLAPV